MKLKIDHYTIKKCEDFADKRTKNSQFYKMRGGFKWEDIYTGALAEYACYKYLKSRGFEVKKPDLTIHSQGKKSYDADLTDGIKNFHVKGQTVESAKRYGNSWLMQRRDPIINDPKFGHYLMPCFVDGNSVEILGCVPLKTIVENDLIGECKVPKFRTNKVALYWDDIKAGLQNNQRWSILY